MMKRVAFFIPVRYVNNIAKVFLQLRSTDDEHLPGFYGLFGGHVDENETFEQGLVREVKEELSYDVNKYQLLCEESAVFDTCDYERKIYWEIVPDNFDDIIIIGEGDGGVWLNEEEVEKINKIFPPDLEKIRKLFVLLKQK